MTPTERATIARRLASIATPRPNCFDCRQPITARDAWVRDHITREIYHPNCWAEMDARIEAAIEELFAFETEGDLR